MRGRGGGRGVIGRGRKEGREEERGVGREEGGSEGRKEN